MRGRANAQRLRPVKLFRYCVKSLVGGRLDVVFRFGVLRLCAMRRIYEVYLPPPRAPPLYLLRFHYSNRLPQSNRSPKIWGGGV